MTTKLLLKYNANPKLNAKLSDFPLQLAIKKGNTEIVELLLRYKVNPNMTHDFQDLPLTLAIEKEQVEIVELLLKYNANPKYNKIFDGDNKIIKLLNNVKIKNSNSYFKIISAPNIIHDEENKIFAVNDIEIQETVISNAGHNLFESVVQTNNHTLGPNLFLVTDNTKKVESNTLGENFSFDYEEF